LISHRGTEPRRGAVDRRWDVASRRCETGIEPMHERHKNNYSFVHRFDPVSTVGPRSGPAHRRGTILSIQRAGRQKCDNVFSVAPRLCGQLISASSAVSAVNIVSWSQHESNVSDMRTNCFRVFASSWLEGLR
jgi:hypothetical protein